MRGAEKVLLIVALGLPLIVATLGWPMLVKWAGGSPPQREPEGAGVAATSVPTAHVAATPRPPTPGLPPTVTKEGRSGIDDADAQPAAERPPAAKPTDAQPGATEAPAAQPPAAAASTSGSPTEAVSSFYALVGQHQFDRAAELWSPRMRSAFPPDENINQRFSSTRGVTLRRAEIVSVDPSRATVAVDLMESDGTARGRHYVGAWQLVHTDTGWLLDQPDLRPAP
jgi:hypothetical protein